MTRPRAESRLSHGRGVTVSKRRTKGGDSEGAESEAAARGAVSAWEGEINRLHEEAKRHATASRAALDAALAAAWHAGELLLAEKKRVFHTMGLGSWLLWIDANFRGTART